MYVPLKCMCYLIYFSISITNIYIYYLFIDIHLLHLEYLAKKEVDIQARENVIREKINARVSAEKEASYQGYCFLLLISIREFEK